MHRGRGMCPVMVVKQKMVLPAFSCRIFYCLVHGNHSPGLTRPRNSQSWSNRPKPWLTNRVSWENRWNCQPLRSWPILAAADDVRVAHAEIRYFSISTLHDHFTISTLIFLLKLSYSYSLFVGELGIVRFWFLPRLYSRQ